MNKKVLLFLCLLLVLILGASASFINASIIIEDEIFITFKDKNLYDEVKKYFSDEDNKIKHNPNEETLTIRCFAKRCGFNNKIRNYRCYWFKNN